MDDQAEEYSTVRPVTQGLALRFCVVERRKQRCQGGNWRPDQRSLWGGGM